MGSGFGYAASQVEKTVGAETTLVSENAICFGVILTSASAVAADAILTLVVNGVDKDIPLDLQSGPQSQSIALPYPVKCGSIKATLVGAGTHMSVFYGL